MSEAKIAVLDYGMGNRRSVEKALERVGARPRITRQPDDVRTADGLVVPGVGAFPEAMRRLRDLALDGLVRERLEAGGPVLGICLGMQLLFERSSEHEGAGGLGLLPGDVTRLQTGGLRLPHIGWSLVRFRRASPLTTGLPEAAAFYHVHTFAARPADDGDVLGVAEYGERFASVVARDPLFGVQFHPEKSSVHGLRLLENFAAICARVAA
jgi:imidazole glycerol-phosphate synthase subunit HisH